MIELIIITVAALLPIVNPFSTAPLFLAITEGYDQKTRNEQALRGVVYMVAILGTFLIAGSLIMNFFGISLPG
ncbi:MAG: stress protection protein MarC, partial [Alkalimonas sp.]|nr:stress protection protein MarC [Alkalimonas sp.]